MLKQHLLSKHRWLVFVLPFLVYMLLGALEPAPAGAAGKTRILPFASASYPLLYTLKIALTLVRSPWCGRAIASSPGG